MRLLIVIPTFYPKLDKGGPIISLYNQLNDLSEKVYLEVITRQKLDKYEKFLIKSNIKINYEILNNNLINFIKNYLNVRKFDVLYINSIFSLHTISYILIGILFKKKIIISPRGSVSESALKKKLILKRTIINLICLIIDKKKSIFLATSILEKNELTKIFRNYKIEVLPNGLNHLDLHYNKKNNNFDESLFRNKKTIVFFSRIDRKKNLHKLIEVLGKYNLIIIGDKSDQDYFNSLNFKNDNISYLGPIYDKPLLKDIFKKCSFLCLPSQFENFANCIIDSINMNCPVLISENVGLKDEIINFKFGNVFKGKITHSDLDLMFDNCVKYRNNILKNKNNFLNKFDWININNKFIDLIKE